MTNAQTPEKSSGRRIEELDSLRGLAAMVVVFNHMLNIPPSVADPASPWDYWVIRYTPLHALWGGHEAVVFFFVLSGLVLSIPFFSRKVGTTGFLIKRVFRIWVPYVVAVAVAMAAYSLFSRGGIPELSRWFNQVWVTPLSWKIVLQHLLLIVSFNNEVYNPVLWSLVHEMRVSLIFPLLMLLVVKRDWKTSLLVGTLISGVFFVLSRLTVRGVFPANDYLTTGRYIVMFIVGALIAKHRGVLVAWFNSHSKASKYLLLAAGMLFYTYAWWFFPSRRALHLGFVEDVMTTVGVFIFVITALSSTVASKFLRSRPVLFIGRASYSLYLYHAILLLTFVNLLYGSVPLWAICGLTLVLSVVVAGYAYLYIELPSINIAKRLSSGL